MKRYVVHVDFADADDEALDSSNVIHEVEGEERDVNILPFDWLD